MSKQMNWIKSTHSQLVENCVEVAHDGDSYWVRDSKDFEGPTLVFDGKAWRAFVRDVKEGYLD